MWFKGQAADFYYSGIQKLVPRFNKYLEVKLCTSNSFTALLLHFYFPDTPRNISFISMIETKPNTFNKLLRLIVSFPKSLPSEIFIFLFFLYNNS